MCVRERERVFVVVLFLLGRVCDHTQTHTIYIYIYIYIYIRKGKRHIRVI